MTWLRGKAKKYSGKPIDYVSLFNWPDGKCIAQVKPDSAGNWKYSYRENLNCGITYVADGCEPITHGPYEKPAIIYPPFVDFIGAVNSLDRVSGANPITAVIPSTVKAGDIMVLGIMRRSTVTVSDSNNGVWTLAVDSFYPDGDFPQGSAIYYRTATASDAGKTVTVSCPVSGRLIVYLSLYRGKNAPLQVVRTIKNPVRYDETYSEMVKNLAPIEHDGGFMVRAVSNVFAATSGDTKSIISNMTNTGDTTRNFSQPLRLQVAYKHLDTGDVLNATYGTGLVNANDAIPDVAIILDEIGR